MLDIVDLYLVADTWIAFGQIHCAKKSKVDKTIHRARVLINNNNMVITIAIIKQQRTKYIDCVESCDSTIWSLVSSHITNIAIKHFTYGIHSTCLNKRSPIGIPNNDQ